MAHSLSARKRVRAASRRNQRNKSIRSQYKTYITKAEKLINTAELDVAEEAVKQATSLLDKTAQKGVLHRNNAARRKSRLVKKLNTARAGAQLRTDDPSD